MVVGLKVFMILDGSDLQTPEQSPACPFCPQKNAAEHFQRSRTHPKREESKKKPQQYWNLVTIVIATHVLALSPPA